MAKRADEQVAGVVGVEVQDRIHVTPPGHHKGLVFVHIGRDAKYASTIHRSSFALNIGNAMGCPEALERIGNARQRGCVEGLEALIC
jgi:hypothetical protein